MLIPKVYVISLVDSAERRASMIKQLSNIDIEWSFFDAIKVTEYPSEYDREHRKQWYGFDLTMGEIGCFISHRTLWSAAVESGQTICILEDDIILKKNFLESLHFAMSYSNVYGILRLMQLQKRHGRLVFSNSKYSMLAFHEQPTGAQAYCITPAAANILLSYTTQIREPIDNIMDQYWKTKIDVLCLEPESVSIADFESCIGNRGWTRRPKITGLKRDIRTGISQLYRLYYNIKRFGKVIY